MGAQRRNFGLDVARAAAITMVFLVHGVTLKGIPVLDQFATGVDLFFVLSGFLIGRIYFKSSTRSDFSIRSFWLARWWRTLPPYLAALGLYGVVRLSFPDRHSPALPWTYGFFLQNYAGIHGFLPTWSLCVEEHFYLVLPLAAWAVDRFLGRSSFRYLLPAAFFTPLLLRAATLLMTGELPRDWYFMTHLHCEGLIAGVWLAYTFVEDPEAFARLERPARKLLPLIPAMLFVLPLWTSRGPAVNLFVFTFLAVGYAAWVRVLYDLKPAIETVAGKLVHRVVEGLALCSYSIYLTHTIFAEPLRGMTENWPRGVLRSSAVLGGELFFGVIFYFLVERVAIQLRDRILAKQRDPLPHPIHAVSHQTAAGQ